MFLKELNESDGRDVFEMLQQLGTSENEFHNAVNGMKFDDYKRWLIQQAAWARGEDLPEGYVKQWTYWLFNGAAPVGYGKLREKVTDQSRQFGGNIGFAVAPGHRGKGYGDFLFHGLLEQGRAKGVEELYSTVEKYNYVSKHIHEKNGGRMVGENEVRWFFVFEA